VPVSHGSFVGHNRVLIATADGFPIYASADDRSLTPALVSRGWYDEALLGLLDRVLRTGDWFVDVGANIGLFTVAAATRVGPTGHVLSYEPDPDTASLLRDNVALNWIDQRVTVTQSAVGRRQGTIDFARHPQWPALGVASSNEFPGRTAAEGYETFAVPIERLDGRVPDGTRLRLVKIDVEGGEADVLEGMEGLFSRSAVDLVTLEVLREHAGENWPRLGQILRSLVEVHGARCHSLTRWGRLRPVPLDDVLERGHFTNLVVAFSSSKPHSWPHRS
jgi:FkbM family methyltransferase